MGDLETRVTLFEQFDKHMTVEARAVNDEVEHIVVLKFGHQSFHLFVMEEEGNAQWMKLTFATVLSKIAAGEDPVKP